MSQVDEFIEEYILSDEAEDDASNFPGLADDGKPGLMVAVKMVAGLSSPYIENGTAYIPSGEIEGTTTPTANSATGRFGIVGSVQPGNAWGISDGHIYVGVADAGSAGVISSANFNKAYKTPTFVGGALNLPLAQAPTGACNGTVDDDTPGGIVGIGYSEDGDFRIEDGYARIPKPTIYEFDPEWFEVIDGQVTLKNAAIEGAINELVDELAVNIDVTTDLEHVNVKAGEKIIRATSDATLTLDTNVKSVNV